MINATVLLAFTAGMVATFNPCGFSLLPAYIGAFVVGDDLDAATPRRLARAVGVATAVSTGFVLVFAAAGIMIESLTGQIRRNLPWVTVSIGVALIVAGVATLVGWKPRLPITTPRLTGRQRGLGLMIGYGIVYAVASLSCTIGPFLAVTGAALTQSTLGGVSTYVAYALGMGLIILVISIASTLAHTAVTRQMRRFSGGATKVGGALMVLAGIYVGWYARWELAVFSGNPDTDPAIEVLEGVRMWFVSLFDSAGSGVLVAVALVVLGAGTLVWMRARRLDPHPGVAGTSPSDANVGEEKTSSERRL